MKRFVTLKGSPPAGKGLLPIRLSQGQHQDTSGRWDPDPWQQDPDRG